MAITMHLYYTGQGGSARAFAQEMETTGTAAALREKYDLHMRAERLTDDAGDVDESFLRK